MSLDGTSAVNHPCTAANGQLPLGDRVRLASATPLSFCGIRFTGLAGPDWYYSETVEAIEEAESMYEDLSAKYEAMERDWLKKENDLNDLEAKYDLLEADYNDIVTYRDNVEASTANLAERQANLEAQLLAVEDEYDLAVADMDALTADNEQRDTNIESYSEVSTMAEKCMIGPIAGWFWYCREGDALVREEDAEEEAEEAA